MKSTTGQFFVSMVFGLSMMWIVGCGGDPLANVPDYNEMSDSGEFEDDESSNTTTESTQQN